MKIAIALTLVALVLAGAPVPSHPEGYKWNTASDLKVKLDVYEDLLCSDCAYAIPFLMNFMKSQDTHGNLMADQVELTIHFFPLPFHHHAFIVTRAAALTWDSTHDAKTVSDFADWVYTNIAEFGSKAKTQDEGTVKSNLCSLASDQFGWTESECLTSYQKGKTDSATRAAWKFAAYNSVTGTPTAFVNGVQVEDFPISINGWNALLKNSLNGSQAIIASE
jgi:protein-disulfide isomerase